MKRIGLILGAMVLMSGCAQEKKSDGNVQATAAVDCARTSCTTTGVPGAPGSATNGTGVYSSGSTVPLTNVVGLSSMFFDSKPTQATNIQINVDLSRTTHSVVVSYLERGKWTEAGLGIRFPGGTRENARYNGWVTIGSSRVYKGFFQDSKGAVILVIDKVLNSGDGAAAPTVGGSIWFQNFIDDPYYDSPCQSGDPIDPKTGQNTCFQKQLMCWEITYGPYDCRSWVTATSNYANAVNLAMSVDPTGVLGRPYQSRTKSYQKLGDFTGLSRAAANLPNP